jgi:hypothetical protein
MNRRPCTASTPPTSPRAIQARNTLKMLFRKHDSNFRCEDQLNLSLDPVTAGNSMTKRFPRRGAKAAHFCSMRTAPLLNKDRRGCAQIRGRKGLSEAEALRSGIKDHNRF